MKNKITQKSHLYRVQLSPSRVVAFPAAMTLDEIEVACKDLHGKQTPSKKRKALKADRGSAALGAMPQEDL